MADEAFGGAPWGTAPTVEWNQPGYWDAYYGQLMVDPDNGRRDSIVHRQVDRLIGMLTNAGELPRQAIPSRLLDAGSGIALIPYILAFWGFEVAAVDFCPQAVQAAARQHPDREALARCVPIWERPSSRASSYALVDDPARSRQRLESYHAPGGSVSFVNCDWFDTGLPTSGFDVIYCRNSLRSATKPYWRRSVERFHALLAPDGVLLLETVNAIGVRDEVEELFVQAGFASLTGAERRTAACRYVMAAWPTG